MLSNSQCIDIYLASLVSLKRHTPIPSYSCSVFSKGSY